MTLMQKIYSNFHRKTITKNVHKKGVQMKKKIPIILLFSILTIILLLIPFAIEKIILCESIFPFNFPISFFKESWFGFIASYLGAVGTILLGIIALYQNKKYKELSDTSEERFMSLQEEIKTLTEKVSP